MIPARSTSGAHAQTIQRLAARSNFSLLGFAPAQPSEHADHLRDWLASGRHGQMTYLADKLQTLLDPQKLLPNVRSIICVADAYAQAPGNKQNPAATPAPAGRIARYAWGDDYHAVIKKRLHRLADDCREVWPDHQFRSAVDTAPLLEREHAARSGLGWIGKHSLLIHPVRGSWLLLGEILTTLPLETAQDRAALVTDHCGSCTRCIQACPTQCIHPDGYSIDASRCISYLTIEHKGPIDPALQPAMGDWIAGCDICQEVCPFNDQSSAAEPASGDHHPPLHPAYQPRPPAPAIPLADILSWSSADREAAFIKSALKRIKLDQLKRNALIAAANYLEHNPDPALHRRITQIAADASEPDLVRQTAQQLLPRITTPLP